MMSALHSRAYLLLQKDLYKLKQLNLWGIEIDLIQDNIFDWQVTFAGLKDTSWQDGQFVVSLKFSESYNTDPPEVFFQTIPLHPNIDERTGIVCLDCLDDWDSEYPMSYILLSLQTLLSEPSFINPLNANASKIACESPIRYKQLVLDGVLMSRRTPSRSPPLEETMTSATTIAQPEESANEISKLSFEAYHNLWKSVGTTRHSADSPNPFMDLMNEDFQKLQYGSIKDELNQEVYRQLSEHQMLMYGQFNKNKKIDQKVKANKIKFLKDLHANKRGVRNLHVALPASPLDEDTEETVETEYDDINEIEAKDLLSWTQSLPNDV